MEAAKDPRTALDAIGAPTATRHLFLCIGPDCCEEAAGLEVWQYLKKCAGPLPVLRSKAACLRVCQGGPWLVIYPDGAWYGGVTVERCERILREHVVGGRPVQEWLAFPPCLPQSKPTAAI